MRDYAPDIVLRVFVPSIKSLALTFLVQHNYPEIVVCVIYIISNSPVLQFGAPPAIDSGEAKRRTASWENVDK